jgi:isocitrate dehydrogenase
VFEKHEALFNEIGVDANNGIGDVYAKIEGLSAESRVKADLETVYETRAKQAMVDSDKGITNLHVPSNVIIDASMPAAIRSSGQMSAMSVSWRRKPKNTDHMTRRLKLPPTAR